MCGIAGFTWNDPVLIGQMLKLLTHRGPDGEDFIFTPNITLGQNRLAIVDPMSWSGITYNENQTILLAYNGEIYNQYEIRELLIQLGHKFSSLNDAEIIVHSFEEWGEKSFGKFNGMFAFALYDKGQEILYLVRDPLGIKNVYYSLKGANLIFASEIKAILLTEPAVYKNNSFEDIKTYGYIPSRETSFAGIYSLQPGTFLRVHKKEITSQSYFSFKKYKAEFHKTNLLAILDSTVRKMVISEVPIAVALSGGLDSSIITVLAHKYNPNIKAFSLGFSQEDNEFEYSRAIAKMLGIEYEEVLLPKSKIDNDLDQILYYQETPQDGGSVVPKWYLAEHIHRQGYKVVIGGSGADEIFGGYRRNDFRFSQLREKHILNIDDDFEYFRQNIIKSEGNPWLFSEYSHAKNSFFDIVSFFDVLYELPYYHNPRLDKTFMAHGIEYRVPFQDVSLAEYVLNIPYQFRIENGVRKKLLKDIATDLLPIDIVERPKKAFQLPEFLNDREEWLANLFSRWQTVFKVTYN